MLAGTAAGFALLSGEGGRLPLLLMAAVTAGLAVWLWRADGLVRTALARLERLSRTGGAAGLASRLEAALAQVEANHGAVDGRSRQRHAATGLPTREPLIARMAGDAAGTLAAISFAAFDRICSFDPAQGERLLLALVDRLTRMLPADRLVAHVDRATLAVWYGPDIIEAVARAELDALAYALGDVLQDGDQTITPDIQLRIAALTPEGATPQLLIARTIAALSLPGATQTVVVEPLIDTAAVTRERYAMEQDLRQAVARGEFQLRFQPLVDAAQHRVSGAEALIRWSSPRHGQVSPARFVPIVEAAGLATEMGLWALNGAMRTVRDWRDRGTAGLRIAVNVSGHQLERDDLPMLIERTLARHALGADVLEIELTETVATSNDARTAALFESLHALGVSIAIDDFGTGYSSFSSLRQLTFNKIKIDREFVTDVDRRRDSQAICQSIIALGRGLGIRVLAEGLERREEYEWLRTHGCQHFQGYYFSPPLDEAAFLAFVQDTDGLAARLAVGPREALRRTAERFAS